MIAETTSEIVQLQYANLQILKLDSHTSGLQHDQLIEPDQIEYVILCSTILIVNY